MAAGCGGGGGGGTALPQPVASATASPSATSTPGGSGRITFTGTSQSAAIGALGTTVVVPTNWPYNLSVTFPQAISGAGNNVTVTLATTAPTGIPTQSFGKPFAWAIVQVSGAVTFTSAPSFIVGDSLNAETPALSYDMAFYDSSHASNGYTQLYEGPALWWNYTIKTPIALNFTPEAAGTLTLQPGAIYVLPIYSIRNETELTLFPSGYTAGEMAVGSDGAAWFIAIGNGSTATGYAIGRMTTAGYAAIYANSGISVITSIALGPDGNIWFTGSDSSGHPIVGRITPSAAYQLYEYAQPGVSYFTPAGITRAGNTMWFIAPNSTGVQLGSVTTSGAVSLVTTATSSACPYNLQNADDVYGPDGALWVGGSSYISRVQADGSRQCFPLPASYPYAYAPIFAGGNLWFISNDAVLSMTTTGKFTIFPLGQSVNCFGTSAFSMAKGPGGALYFDAYGSLGNYGCYAIGKIGSGTIHQFTLPELGQNVGNTYLGPLVQGPDGALWFGIDYSIGRLSLP